MDRVLHILPMNKMSGAERMALLMCKNLKSFEAIVVCGGDKLKRIFEKDEIRSYSINFSKKNLLTVIVKLKNIIRENNIKIIHAHDNNASLVAYLTKRIFKLNIKVVSHIHSCYPWLKKETINKKLDRYLRPRYDVNIFCGNDVYNFYINNSDYINHQTTKILSNSIDITMNRNIESYEKDKIEQLYNIPENRTVLGFIGRLCDIKGLIPFIDEVSKRREQFNDSIILLVGSGDQEVEIRNLINELNLNDLFVLTGFQEEVNIFYKIIDVFFLPSRYEGLPMVILEAMAFSKPIISMNVGGIGEVIRDNTGKVIESGDYIKFVDELIKIKDNKQIQKLYGDNAYKFVMNNYDIKKYINDLEEKYDELIEGIV
jgi:glycosyltransferase involved in cell wall biosynthesis